MTDTCLRVIGVVNADRASERRASPASAALNSRTARTERSTGAGSSARRKPATTSALKSSARGKIATWRSIDTQMPGLSNPGRVARKWWERPAPKVAEGSWKLPLLRFELENLQLSRREVLASQVAAVPNVIFGDILARHPAPGAIESEVFALGVATGLRACGIEKSMGGARVNFGRQGRLPLRRNGSS